jgi:hypothetical protein
MWYWGENGRQWVDKTIVVGAENNHVPQILGWERTDTLSEAIDLARGAMGRGASVSLVHMPPILQTDVRPPGVRRKADPPQRGLTSA